MLTGKKPKSDFEELAALGEHCTRTERRAETAERELIKVKLLTYLENKVGERFHAILTGVEDFGLFARLVELPAEGLVHVTSLADDYYYLEGETHTLVGRAVGPAVPAGGSDRGHDRRGSTSTAASSRSSPPTSRARSRPPRRPARLGRPASMPRRSGSRPRKPKGKGNGARQRGRGRGKPKIESAAGQGDVGLQVPDRASPDRGSSDATHASAWSLVVSTRYQVRQSGQVASKRSGRFGSGWLTSSGAPHWRHDNLRQAFDRSPRPR